MAGLTKNEQQVYDFLKKTGVGVLATSYRKAPHAVVIFFSVNDDLSVSFITRAKTRKHSNIKHNKRVALLAFDTKTQSTALVEGKASEIRDEEAADAVFDKSIEASMKKSKVGVPPLSKLQAGDYIAYTIVPALIKLNIYTEPGESGVFKEISLDY